MESYRSIVPAPGDEFFPGSTIYPNPTADRQEFERSLDRRWPPNHPVSRRSFLDNLRQGPNSNAHLTRLSAARELPLPFYAVEHIGKFLPPTREEDFLTRIRSNILIGNAFASITGTETTCHALEVWTGANTVPSLEYLYEDLTRLNNYYRAVRFSCTGEVVESTWIPPSNGKPGYYDVTAILAHMDKCQTNTTDIGCHKMGCSFTTNNVGKLYSHSKVCQVSKEKLPGIYQHDFDPPGLTYLDRERNAIRVAAHVAARCTCENRKKKPLHNGNVESWLKHIESCPIIQSETELMESVHEAYAEGDPRSFMKRFKLKMREAKQEKIEKEIEINKKYSSTTLQLPCGQPVIGSYVVAHITSCLQCTSELCRCARKGFGTDHQANCPYRREMLRFCPMCCTRLDPFGSNNCHCAGNHFYSRVVPHFQLHGTHLGRDCKHTNIAELQRCHVSHMLKNGLVDVYLPPGTLERTIEACIQNNTSGIQAQVGWSIIPESVTEEITNVCNKLQESLTGFDLLTTDVRDGLSQAKSTISSTFSATATIPLVIGCFSDVHNYLTGEWNMTRTIMFIASIVSRVPRLTMALGSILYEKIFSWASTIHEWATTPVADEPKAEAYEPISTTVKGVIAMLFTVISAMIYGSLPGEGTVRKAVNTIAVLGGASRAFKFTAEGISSLFHFVFSHTYEFYYGVSPYAGELLELSEEFASWMNAVKDEKMDNRKLAMTDTDRIAKIRALFSEGLELQQKVMKSSLRPQAVALFNTHWTMINALHTRVQSVLVGSGASFSEPTVVLLAGPSGVGKSTITPILGTDLLTQTMGIETENPKNYMYNRNIEQEYWDGYQAQPICIYDDFGQMKDAMSAPNLEYMEIIRTANTTPSMLHMADLADKANTPFASTLIMCTSNIAYHDPRSITAPEAVRRRFDLAFWVEKNPAYEGKEISTEYTRYAQYDPKEPFSPSGVTEWMSYEAMAGLVAKKYLSKKQQFADQNTFMKRHAERENFLPRDPDLLPAVHEPVATEEVEELEEQKKLNHIKSFERDTYPSTSKLDIRKALEPQDFNGDWFNGHYRDLHLELPYAFQIDDPCVVADEICESLEAARKLGMVNLEEHTKYKKGSDNYMNAFGLMKYIRQADLVPTDRTFLYIHLSRRYRMVQLRDEERISEQPQTNYDVHDLTETEESLRVWVQFAMRHARFSHSWQDGVNVPLKKKFSHYRLKCSRSWSKFCREHPWVYFSFMVVLGGGMYKLLKGVWSAVTKPNTPEVVKPEVPLETEAGDVGYTDNVLTHRHENMERGRVIDHPHKCENCEKIYRHTHRIKSLKESLRYGSHLCRTCRGDEDPHTEVSSSGDPRTRHRRAQEYRTEVMSSGDPRTNRRPTVQTLPSVESTAAMGVASAAAAGLAGLFAQGGDAKAEALSDFNGFNIRHKMLSNLYQVVVFDKEGNSNGKANLLFVAGRMAHSIGHLRMRMFDDGYLLLTNKHNPTGIRVPTNRIQFAQLAQEGSYKDTLWMSFPNSVPQHPDISKLLCNLKDHSRFKRFQGILCHGIETDYPIMSQSEMHAVDSVNYTDENHTYRIRHGFRYKMETQHGDCGAPIVVVDKSMSRKIVGVHVAGKAGEGFGVAVFQEEYEAALRNFGPSAQISVEVPNELNRVPKTPEGDFLPLGTVVQAPGEAKKTQILPSLVHGKISEPTTKPAHLSWLEVDGLSVHPKDIGLKKAGVACAMLDADLTKECADNFLDNIENADNYDYASKFRRVLTDEEMVRGIEGEAFAPPIVRSTSPGYPWSLNNPEGGKRTWIPEEGPVRKDLMDAIKTRENRAKAQLRTTTLWVDTLKDERRPIAKVDAGKTRVFAAGPVDFTLLFRKYFLGFAAFLEKTRIENEVSVGTNPYSFDWEDTVMKVTRYGDNLVAGDFSNFDGTLQIDILQAIIVMINEWYDGTEEETTVRSILWNEIVNATHLNGRDIYGWTHGQPSGCPLTAILNCCYNSIAVRYVWRLLAVENRPAMAGMTNFTQNVSMVAYGDDNIIGVSDQVKDWFNQHSLTLGFARIGMTYTNEDKSTGGAPTRSLSEISYLKRGFRFEPRVGRHLAPLAMESILETMNWIRKSPDPYTATEDNIKNSLFEMALHGKTTYDEWLPKIKKAVRDANLNLIFPNWEEQIDMRLSGVALGIDASY